MKKIRLFVSAAMAVLAFSVASCTSPTAPDHTIGSGNVDEPPPHTIGSGNMNG